jgi:hypothetical protein
MRHKSQKSYHSISEIPHLNILRSFESHGLWVVSVCMLQCEDMIRKDMMYMLMCYNFMPWLRLPLRPQRPERQGSPSCHPSSELVEEGHGSCDPRASGHGQLEKKFRNLTKRESRIIHTVRVDSTRHTVSNLDVQLRDGVFFEKMSQ